MTDYHLAIWELLTPEERHESKIQFEKRRKYWYCFPKASDSTGPIEFSGGHTIPDFIAHRAILDAARGVCDLSRIAVRQHEDPSDGWWWESDTDDDVGSYETYPTRTECIYHALKWMREEKK
jgi:hypothetical protein